MHLLQHSFMILSMLLKLQVILWPWDHHDDLTI
jgi:hypothetical protein